MVRMGTSLSIMPARRGKCSQISMPGTLVLMGLNSPRTSAGASGFRSYMSWCGGPPGRKIMITERAERRPLAASARRMSLIDNPPKASPPIFRNPRRETRSQNAPARFCPKMVNMRGPTPR